MATLQTLYNNIKTLITKYFEEKTIEDETLPQIVESYFNYNQGKLNIDMPHMELTVTGSSFTTYSSTPFTYTGRVVVDWGDDTGLIEYTGGELYHSYSVSDTYTVKIYGNITSLRDFCFYNCIGLTSVIIPDSVSSLGYACFYSCTGLISITLPNSVTSLGNSCFNNCTGLTSITLPDSVTSLGEGCFSRCTGLTSIQLNWNTTTEIITYNSTWIYQASANVKFNIPNGTTSLYSAKDYPSNLLVESNMGLLENIITLVNKYFYKTEEKPIKYMEWLISEYSNGKWYIGEEAPEISIYSQNIESVKATSLQENAIYRVIIYCGTDIDDNQLKTGWAFSSPSNHMIIGAGTIDRLALQQTQTITIEPYFDSENNIFYTGCSWTGTITLA